MCVPPNASGPTVGKQIMHCKAWEHGHMAHCDSHRVVKRLVCPKCAECIKKCEQKVLATYSQVPSDGATANSVEKKGRHVKNKAPS